MFKVFNDQDIYVSKDVAYLANTFDHATETVGFHTGTNGGPGIYTMLTGVIEHWSVAGAHENPVMLVSGSNGFDIHLMYGASRSSIFLPTSSATNASQRTDRARSVYNKFAAMWEGKPNSTADTDGFVLDALNTTMEEVIFVSFFPSSVSDRFRRGHQKVFFTTGASTGWLAPAGFAVSNVILTATDGAWDEKYKLRLGNDYGMFFSASSGAAAGWIAAESAPGPGGIHYNAGWLALDPQRMIHDDDTELWFSGTVGEGLGSHTLENALTGTSPGVIMGGLLHRMAGLHWHGERHTRSLVFYCHAGPDEFGYSSNPTFTSGTSGKVWSMSGTSKVSTYVTTIGLYNPAQELLAVARLNKPNRKQHGDAPTYAVPIVF